MSFLHQVQKQTEDMEDSGITVFLKVNYKVILLVAVVFDLVHTSVNEFILRWLP